MLYFVLFCFAILLNIDHNIKAGQIYLHIQLLMAITSTILSVRSTSFKLRCRYRSTLQWIFLHCLRFTYLVPDKMSKNQIYYANNFLKCCMGVTSGKHNTIALLNIFSHTISVCCYGPLSSKNVYCMFKVERWWRRLHQRLDKFYKEGLAMWKDQSYDPTNDIHR